MIPKHSVHFSFYNLLKSSLAEILTRRKTRSLSRKDTKAVCIKSAYAIIKEVRKYSSLIGPLEGLMSARGLRNFKIRRISSSGSYSRDNGCWERWVLGGKAFCPRPRGGGEGWQICQGPIPRMWRLDCERSEESSLATMYKLGLDLRNTSAVAPHRCKRFKQCRSVCQAIVTASVQQLLGRYASATGHLAAIRTRFEIVTLVNKHRGLLHLPSSTAMDPVAVLFSTSASCYPIEIAAMAPDSSHSLCNPPSSSFRCTSPDGTPPSFVVQLKRLLGYTSPRRQSQHESRRCKRCLRNGSLCLVEHMRGQGRREGGRWYYRLARKHRYRRM